MTERMEHMHKSITRDLLAGERNHAVLPVAKFGARFAQFFDSALFSSVPSPTAAQLLRRAMSQFSALAGRMHAGESDEQGEAGGTSDRRAAASSPGGGHDMRLVGRSKLEWSKLEWSQLEWSKLEGSARKIVGGGLAWAGLATAAPGAPGPAQDVRPAPSDEPPG